MAVFVGILLIICALGLGYFAYTNGITTPTEALSFYEKDIKCFRDGSCIEIKKDRKAVVPVDYDTDDITNSTYSQNGTAIPDSNIPIEQGIEQYNLGYDRPVVNGYIRLLDSSGNPIIPYIYNWHLSISCADSMEWCNLNPPFEASFRQPETRTTDGGKDIDGNDLGGEFYYKWTPPANSLAGIYDVTVSVTSQVVNEFGQYPTNHITYQIQLVE